MEKDEIEDYLNKYSLKIIDYKDSKDLEKLYFTNKDWKIIGRINQSHLRDYLNYIRQTYNYTSSLITNKINILLYS